MTKRQSVEDLYGGRHRPYGQVRDGSHRRIESEPSLEPKRGGAFNSNVVQDPENKHDVRYDNDVADDWRRGGGKGQATSRPGFDKGQSYRRADGGDDWNSQTRPDRVEFVTPPRVAPNAKQRKTGG